MPHPASSEPIPLWPNGAPGARGHAAQDIPTIKPFFPDAQKASGAAMLVCPGGGYEMLADHEGEPYARFFNAHGIAAFVLKYRLGGNGYHYPAMFQDVSRAVRHIRAHAADWGIDPARVGIIGCSAAGHLASTLLTHFDHGAPGDPDPIERQGSRPDVGILCYPVITMGPQTHEGTKGNLLGPNPAPGLAGLLSNEHHVSAATPPCFVWHTWEDTVVPIENSFAFTRALRDHGVPFDLHIYERGAHGIGLGAPWNEPQKLHPWTRDCIYWLKLRRFVS